MFRKSKAPKQHNKQDETDTPLHETPMVCLFDCAEETENELRKLKFSSFSGSLGAEIEVNNAARETKLLRLNRNSPDNLHEYDVVVLDFTNKKRKKYEPNEHDLGNVSGSKAYAFISRYPEQIFNPIPYSVFLISREIAELASKKSIVIAFLESEDEVEYDLIEITPRGNNSAGRKTLSSLNFYHSIPSHSYRNGRKVLIPKGRSKLSALLEKHLDNIEYNVVFNHPTKWIDNEYQNAPNFIPLLANERDEIISYAHFQDELLILVFPNILQRASFVSELFKTYLPEIMPELFPYHGEFGWLDNGEYLLPGEKALIEKRTEIEQKYEVDVRKNETQIGELKTKYKFLSDLLSG